MIFQIERLAQTAFLAFTDNRKRKKIMKMPQKWPTLVYLSELIELKTF